MLLLWKEGIPYWKVALGYSFVGIGVGLAGTPASHSLTGSVPVKRVGMASGTADLQRDLGGAIMQSIFGALLTAGYAAAARRRDRGLRKARLERRPERADEVVLERDDTAASYPPSIQDKIVAGAKTAFLHGDQWAYTAGIVAVLLGAALVWFKFPKRDDEQRLLAAYRAEDSAAAATDPSGLDAPVCDGLLERRVVLLVLVRVALGKLGQRLIEHIARAEVARRSRSRLPTARAHGRASSHRACRRPPSRSAPSAR